jgi:hypothetical protein
MKYLFTLLAALTLSVFAPAVTSSAQAQNGVTIQTGPNGFGISITKYRNNCRSYSYRQNYRNRCGYDQYDNNNRYRYNQNRYYHQDQYNRYYRQREGRDWRNRRGNRQDRRR